ncbi:hypothetical protein K1719_031493 [Acacia pycnantha]|nr:hypothetical protein K1719_031493 [Acacia pycnantha]
MQDTKDPAIKLFGKNIPLQGDAAKGGGRDEGGQKKRQDDEADKESDIRKVTESPEEKETEETAKSSENDDGTNSQEKILKKPDQVLPCPRCNSMITKFCYFNNYNINQPRHFCKSCQRYWTEGGTMRNVPVGAGRRKTKNNNSSHYRYITINETLRVARISAPNGTNGQVLSFGSDSPMKSVLNHAENKIVSKSTRNDVRWLVPPGFPPPLLSNHPAAFRNANLPSFSTNLSSPTLTSPICGRNYSILGKHVRDWDMLEAGDVQREDERKQRSGSVLVPKTLRIDDPSEAAKSSIWRTLGIKKESWNGGSVFDAFQSSKDGKNQKHEKVETCPVLRANPAALSRSVYFHENTGISSS